MGTFKNDQDRAIELYGDAAKPFQEAIQQCAFVYAKKFLAERLPSSDFAPIISVDLSRLLFSLIICVEQVKSIDVKTVVLECVEQKNLYEKSMGIELKIESKKDRTLGTVKVDAKARSYSHTFNAAIKMGYDKIFGLGGGYAHNRGITTTKGSNTEDKQCISFTSSITSRSEVPKGFKGVLAAHKIRRKHTESSKAKIVCSGMAFCSASKFEEKITQFRELDVGELCNEVSGEFDSDALIRFAIVEDKQLYWIDEAEISWEEELHKFHFELKALTKEVIPERRISHQTFMLQSKVDALETDNTALETEKAAWEIEKEKLLVEIAGLKKMPENKHGQNAEKDEENVDN
uniref:Uncharacterized protein n=1 Tax=Ditylenchus dipsaci TaxID=166011 RepID=A0A915DVW7_9BILA